MKSALRAQQTAQPAPMPATWIMATILVSLIILSGVAESDADSNLRTGQRLTDASLITRDGTSVRLADRKGRVKIVSVVPQLNTPVCDEQTHRFSENNGGLDEYVDIYTISTNSYEDQALFARKAGIENVTFLSDSPSYEFGTRTGLLVPMLGVLHRAVIVTDDENIIRHVEIVPMSQLPNFDAALEAARKLAQRG